MGTGKKKIEIKRIEKESQRLVTFSKRRKGLFKKANELHSITGAQIALLVFSPAGRPFTHGDPNFEATIDHYLRSTVEETSTDQDCETKLRRACLDLDSINVEAYDNVEELVLLQKRMEEIKGMLVQRIEDNFVGSFLV